MSTKKDEEIKVSTEFIRCSTTDNVFLVEYIEGVNGYKSNAMITKEEADDQGIKYLNARLINVAWVKREMILQIKW